MGNPIGLVMIAVALGVTGQLLMKMGMNQVGAIDALSLDIAKSVASNLYVVFGFACYGLSSVFYLLGLSKLDLSVAYPLVGLGYVLVVFFSWALLKEPVDVWRWLGVLLIFGGVWLIGR
ncbi:MAG: EamA family transporter [Chloroflexi bacterium]|nr:EamA family transporter [Chloroflexota bacterium]